MKLTHIRECSLLYQVTGTLELYIYEGLFGYNFRGKRIHYSGVAREQAADVMVGAEGEGSNLNLQAACGRLCPEKGTRFWNLNSTPSDFLQQGHAFQTYSHCTPNWGPSSPTVEPMRDILTQTTSYP